MNNWISVKDRLPDKQKCYLCYLESGKMIGLWFNKKRQQFLDWYEISCFDTILYWQPLPPPPQEV